MSATHERLEDGSPGLWTPGPSSLREPTRQAYDRLVRIESGAPDDPYGESDDTKCLRTIVHETPVPVGEPSSAARGQVVTVAV